jgi:hypothetical protein
MGNTILNSGISEKNDSKMSFNAQTIFLTKYVGTFEEI